PIHWLMQTSSNRGFFHNRYPAFMHLLGQGHTGKRYLQRICQYFIIAPDVFRLVAALKTKIQAFTVTLTDSASFGGKGMPHRQAVTSIIYQIAALSAAYGIVH